MSSPTMCFKMDEVSSVSSHHLSIDEERNRFERKGSLVKVAIKSTLTLLGWYHMCSSIDMGKKGNMRPYSSDALSHGRIFGEM